MDLERFFLNADFDGFDAIFLKETLQTNPFSTLDTSFDLVAESHPIRYTKVSPIHVRSIDLSQTATMLFAGVIVVVAGTVAPAYCRELRVAMAST